MPILNRRLYLFLAYLSIIGIFVVWALLDYVVMLRMPEYQVVMWVIQPIMLFCAVTVMWVLSPMYPATRDRVSILLAYIGSIITLQWFCFEDWLFFTLTPAPMPALGSTIGWMSWGIMSRTFWGTNYFTGYWFRVSVFVGFTIVSVVWLYLILYDFKSPLPEKVMYGKGYMGDR